VIRRALALAAALAGCAGEEAGARVELRGAGGAVVGSFAVVARLDTPEGRARGLVGRAPLGPDEALVLDYPVVDEACVTNAEVGSPITVVFAGADGAVRGVESLAAHDARVPCRPAVLTVVELAATARAAADAASRVLVR
jgi:uncharacterized membrane protein (UPF0127 family)